MRWTSLTGLGLGIAGAALIWKGYTNSKRLDIREEEIGIAELPHQFHGFRLLHLTDLHLRQNSTRGDELLSIIEDLDPDLVCLTGDYVYTSLSLPDIEAFFRGLSQRPTVIGTFGNADYREGITASVRSSWERFFPFLANSALCLDRHGESCWVVGVDDPHLGRDSLLTALTCVPPGAPVILLAHSPEIIERPMDPRVRLILCGHTHGGQICLPCGRALYHNTTLPARYSAGRHQLGDAVLYISRGIGSTRLPLRFGCLPEITLFTLRRNREGDK